MWSDGGKGPCDPVFWLDKAMQLVGSFGRMRSAGGQRLQRSEGPATGAGVSFGEPADWVESSDSPEGPALEVQRDPIRGSYRWRPR